MPFSPVATGSNNVNPEWREYLGATAEAIAFLKILLDGTDGAAALNDKIAALAARVDGLIALTRSTDRLVISHVQNENDDGSRAKFSHGLGTENIWYHAWDRVSGKAANRMREVEQTEDSISFRDDDLTTLPHTMAGVFIGVRSDRY